MNDDRAETGGSGRAAVFDVAALAATLPASASSLLLDIRLTDEPAASCRIFRVYRPTPPHYHATCDEYLFMLSGRVTFHADGGPLQEVEPGQLLFFKQGVVHAMPDILEEPVVFLSVDTPRRDPRDVIFVDPGYGTPEDFIQAYG